MSANTPPDETELIEAIAHGAPGQLETLFVRRTQRWPHKLIGGECFTSGTFDDLVETVTPEVAFGLVTEAIRVLVGQRSGNQREIATALLVALARRTDTTELPPALKASWQELLALPCSEGMHFEIEELRRWYRL